jgi:hypothetical protein
MAEIIIIEFEESDADSVLNSIHRNSLEINSKECYGSRILP